MSSVILFRRPSFLWAGILFLLQASALSAQAESEHAETVQPRGDLLVVIGSAGEPAYQADFNKWASRWKTAAEQGNVRSQILGADSLEGATLDEFTRALKSQREAASSKPLWLVLLGHGTFDGQAARFNLQGPDLTPSELEQLLSHIDRPQAVVLCFSASGAFLEPLSQPGRVIVTSTKSGAEINYSRFGTYLASAYESLAADLDKDDQVSLLEAFLFADRSVAEYYQNDGQLATEHPRFDDNGDGIETAGTLFEGLEFRDASAAALEVDGLRAHQWHLIPNQYDQALTPAALQQRNTLEQRISELKAKKATLDEDVYYEQLEALLVELAQLYTKSPEPTSSGF